MSAATVYLNAADHCTVHVSNPGSEEHRPTVGKICAVRLALDILIRVIVFV